MFNVVFPRPDTTPNTTQNVRLMSFSLDLIQLLTHKCTVNVVLPC